MKDIATKYTKGFTLIELMIVVALIGILSAIAIPQYSSYVVKGNRAAAQAFLLDVANREKQYLLDARVYTDSLTTLSATAPKEVDKYYTVEIVIGTGVFPTFTVTAKPKPGTQQAGDGTLELTDSGAKKRGTALTW